MKIRKRRRIATKSEIDLVVRLSHEKNLHEISELTGLTRQVVRDIQQRQGVANPKRKNRVANKDRKEEYFDVDAYAKQYYF